MTFTGVVLAGGQSRRMGRTKALLPGPGAKPLVEVALDALRAAGAEHLLISANDPEPFTHLGLEVVPDTSPGLGPLAGLQAVLRAAPTEWCLVVACDMPTLDPAVLVRVVDRITDPQPREAVIPVAAGRFQPLHAAWHRRALAKIDAALAADRLALKDLIPTLDALRLELTGASFENVNTPEDLRRLGLDDPRQDSVNLGR